MTKRLSRAAITLAARCLGPTRRDWARAMQAEFESATAGGQQLPFAIGCLIAACRDLPRRRDGRFALASHVLALGIVVPLAALQVCYASHPASSVGSPDTLAAPNPYFAGAQLAATPSLLLLWLMLGAAQLRLAWLLVERDWAGVQRAGAVIVAGTATLAISLGVLNIDEARLAWQAVFTIAEMAAMVAIARWHDASVIEPA